MAPLAYSEAAPPPPPLDASEAWASAEVQPGLGELEVGRMLTSKLASLITVRAGECVIELKDGGELPDTAVVSMESDASMLMLERSTSDPRKTNLAHFHAPLNFDPLPQGDFTKVRPIAKGILGEIIRCRWKIGVTETEVAVKQLDTWRLERTLQSPVLSDREKHMQPTSCDGVEAEDAVAEIGILTYLTKQPDLPAFLIKTLAVFSEGSHIWLVTEYAEGGELFDVAASGTATEGLVRSYIWQVLQAVLYLHRHRIGHRDISLENVLLKDGAVRLMDFGMAVQAQSTNGTALRYFRGVGKDFYRAPECYVLKAEDATVVPEAQHKAGEINFMRVGSHLVEVRLPQDAQEGVECAAALYGYTVPPIDIFAVGICMFILGFRCPPWKKAALDDPGFSFVHRHRENGVDTLVRKWRRPLMSAKAMQVVGDMLQVDPSKRLSAAQCLAAPWFAELADNPVPTHRSVL